MNCMVLISNVNFSVIQRDEFEFDGDLWSGLVDFVTVYSKEDIRVTFKDETEIKA